MVRKMWFWTLWCLRPWIFYVAINVTFGSFALRILHYSLDQKYVISLFQIECMQSKQNIRINLILAELSPAELILPRRAILKCCLAKTCYYSDCVPLVMVEPQSMRDVWCFCLFSQQTLLGTGISSTPSPGSSTCLASSSSWPRTSTTPSTSSSPSTSLPDSSCTTTHWPTRALTSRAGAPASGSPCSPSSSATSTGLYPTSTAGPSPSPHA